MHLITKTYGHDLGLSACFRQWRAKSHCRFLHGYALSIKLTFAADLLDENNWVLDFGGLKPVKAWLVETFDHKMLVAQDDPILNGNFGYDMEQVHGLAEFVVVPAVGCEAFAAYVAENVERLAIAPWDRDNRGLRLVEVEVREHGANSAIWRAA